MPKFKIGKVSVFSYNGKTYSTGEVVDIAEEDVKRLTPSDYLIKVKEKPKATKK